MIKEFHFGLVLLSCSTTIYLGFLATGENTRVGAIALIFLLVLSSLALGYSNWCGYYNKGRHTNRQLLLAAFSPSIILIALIIFFISLGVYAGVTGNPEAVRG